MFRIYKDRDKKLEEQYKNDILTNYPNTIYAGYILNPEVEYITAETKEALTAYKEAYDLYKAEKYADVKKKVQEAIVKFPTEILIAKFALLNAYVIKQTASKTEFEQALEIVATAYEGTDEAKQAKRLLDKLRTPKSTSNTEVNNTVTTENVQLQTEVNQPQLVNEEPIQPTPPQKENNKKNTVKPPKKEVTETGWDR